MCVAVLLLLDTYMIYYVGMHPSRTRFKQDIIAEFLAPSRPSNKVLILCDGMPSVPQKSKLMEFFAKRGYWVFHPRYRGSWESSGTFLTKSPHQDILDVIDDLYNGFTRLPSAATEKPKRYKLTPTSLILLGSSFGGPAVILASRDTRVSKAVAFCPVVDWKHLGKAEPLVWMKQSVRAAFGQGYRYTDKDWNKLGKGNFYNPVSFTKSIDGSKLLVIQAKDDSVVPYNPVKKFAASTGAKLVTLPRGGHISSWLIMKPRFYKLFTKFIKQ